MNLFHIPETPENKELCEALWETAALRVERIVTTGQISPPGFWYDQEEDEWITVLSGWGEVEQENGELHRLMPGDTLLLPAHLRHRVSAVSSRPCIWLCIFQKTETKNSRQRT